MNKTNILAAGSIALMALMLHFQLALANEYITVGDYEIETGWLNEPPIAGQQNAIIVNVTDTSIGALVEDLSSLTVAVSYGGQSKLLTLQPLGEETPGQYAAPILPTIAGTYTIILGGKLGDTVVDAQVEVEEVQAASTLQFPSVQPTPQSAPREVSDWVAWLGILLGLIGIGLGVIALRKSR